MPPDRGADLGVDVLIIGGGLQAAYLAGALHRRFSVCVIDDPALGQESLDMSGHLTAGYEGNDVNRIQPARRAASYWRLWVDSEGIEKQPDDLWYVVPAGEESTCVRLWEDASLAYEPARSLPEVFSSGSLEHHRAFRIHFDLVVDPAALLERVRHPVRERCIRGSLVRFGMFTDTVIDTVEIDVRGESLLIVPRFVVVAADGGNAEVLSRLVARFPDHGRRREASETVGSCQAVRRCDVVALRGDLPRLNGWFGRLHVVSHPLEGDVVWLVSLPVDDTRTQAGRVDLRFPLKPDPTVVAETLAALSAAAPGVAGQFEHLSWAAYAHRVTQHPMLAGPDTGGLGLPVPAKLESLGLDGFLALWPSHLAYTMILGDVVAERIADELRASAEFSDPIEPAELASPVSGHPVARWADPALSWLDWSSFVKAYDLPAG